MQGYCRYGDNCKFEHPRGGNAGKFSFINILAVLYSSNIEIKVIVALFLIIKLLSALPALSSILGYAYAAQRQLFGGGGGGGGGGSRFSGGGGGTNPFKWTANDYQKTQNKPVVQQVSPNDLM